MVQQRKNAVLKAAFAPTAKVKDALAAQQRPINVAVKDALAQTVKVKDVSVS